ncbi:MAG: FAD-binding oxidoreductase, partial [Rhodobacteraceae bacterium]|nr:FAD-binding oxidoreductase [Paracoccaceae bacterium]
MARFHELEVTDIHKTIRDAVVVTLKPVNGAATEFDFTQGQYLTFRRDFDGEELRRSYSICAGKDEGRLQVGIKRVDGGTFSTWANEDLKVGDRLEAMPPMGGFFTPLDATQEKQYLGFAGGSGITPVLSLIKTTLALEPNSTFTLVYANKAVTTIMFREEIEDLKNIYMGRFNVIHVLESDAQDIDLFTGLVTEEKCAE